MFLKLKSFYNNLVNRLIPQEIKNLGGDNLLKSQMYIRVFCFTLPLIPMFALAFRVTGSPHVEMFCWASAIIFSLSYPVFLITRSPTIASHVMVAGAMVALVFGSFYAGGISAPGVIWFADAQLLAALLFNRKTSFVWALLIATGALALGFSNLLGFNFQNELQENYSHHLKIVTVAGSAIVLFFIVSIINEIKDDSKKEIDLKNEQLTEALSQNLSLIRLISHDVSNSLSILQLTLERMRQNKGDSVKNLDRIQNATTNIANLVHHVREQQSLLTGKKDIQLKAVSLSATLDQVVELLKDKIDEKTLRSI